MAIDFKINGQAVDTDGVLSMPLTRQFDDMTNPIAIKNSVSKTITIPATQNNNTIFGNIWRIDHITGGLFDASKRVPFVLANDGALVTTGYVKLTNIKKKNGVPRAYEIHLYGGLGDFFYELESKDLQDVEITNEIDHPNLSHTINTDAIVSPPEGMKYFMSYQGKYEGFDSKKEYTGYTANPFNELPFEVDEHQRLEFRSYYQRPAVKVSDIVDNIFKGSQYNVLLSDGFKATPYWQNTYLGLISPEQDDATIDYPAVFKARVGDNEEIRFNENYKTQIKITKIRGNNNNAEFHIGDSSIFGLEDGIIHAGTTQEAKGVDFTINFQVGVIGYFRGQARYTFFWDTPHTRLMYFGVRLVEVATGKQIGMLKYDWVREELGYDTFGTKHPETKHLVLKDVNTQGADKFQLKGSQGADKFQLKGSLYLPAGTGDVRVEFVTYTPPNNKPQGDNVVMNAHRRPWLDTPVTLFYAIDETNSSVVVRSTTSIRSGKTVNYSTFVPSGTTQLGFLKNYTKSFGLLWEKDPLSSNITVMTRNEFFAGYKIIDWTELIDLSKDISITPIPFSYRYALLGWGEAETEKAKQYKSQYRNQYGAMKLDTGYEFDGTDKVLLEDDIITNAVISMEYDPAFVGRNDSFPNRDDKAIPAIFEQKDVTRERCDDTMQLLFWDGWKECKEYRLTDDTPQMTANGYCWLGENVNDPEAHVIKKKEYPSMVRMQKVGDNWWSLDFSKPRISYYPLPDELAGGDGTDNDPYVKATIYSRFWRAFMRERLNKDTRIMTCYVWITPAEFATWRFNTFVKIENTLWHVNKIMDFDPSKQSSTKCELIRVNDMQAYINGQNY